ncbi:MotA/TolQ/ExbB proton channel domain-containing protein [Bordetella sputigena]|uniref:hypothetical protein n=1 Tax=Bordetella sputigena TaxID=1416810 RepID=UPI0039EE9905
MLDSLNNLYAANTAVVYFVIAMILLGIAVALFRFNLWFRDLWVSLPLIGSLARLSKDRTKGNDGWLRAEESLCAIYKPFCNFMSEAQFAHYSEYLRKASDKGQKPAPLSIWTLLVVLVIAEGIGFSYMLSSWMATEASSNMVAIISVCVVFVICVIMVMITHQAGHQYRRTKLLRACFAQFKENDSSANLEVEQVGLNDRGRDDHAPYYNQILNRIAKNPYDRGSYGWVYAAVILIVGIAVLSTGLRYMHMLNEQTRESAQMTGSSASFNPFSAALPDAVTAPQKAADDKARSEVESGTSVEGMTAFLMLSLIYIATQAIGLLLGYKYGFVGNESRNAYDSTGGFSDYGAYKNHYQPIRDLVNGRLKDLQQRLEANANNRMKLTKTFDDYLREANQRSSVLDMADHAARAPAPAAAGSPHMATSQTSDMDRIRAHIDALNDPEQEKAYFLSLDATVRNDAGLRAWLKARKDRREQEAQNAAAEGLF